MAGVSTQDGRGKGEECMVNAASGVPQLLVREVHTLLNQAVAKFVWLVITLVIHVLRANSCATERAGCGSGWVDNGEGKFKIF